MKKNGWGIILLTFIISLVLLMIPLPTFLLKFRPLFPLLVVLYWVACCPDRIGVTIAWVMGLLTDFLYGVILGPYAMGFAIAAYCILRIEVRFKMAPLFQQMMTIGFLALGIQLLMIMTAVFLKIIPFRLDDFWIVLTTFFTWPLVRGLLGSMRYRSQVES